MDGTTSFFFKLAGAVPVHGMEGFGRQADGDGHTKHGRAPGRPKNHDKQNADFRCSTGKKYPV